MRWRRKSKQTAKSVKLTNFADILASNMFGNVAKDSFGDRASISRLLFNDLFEIG